MLILLMICLLLLLMALCALTKRRFEQLLAPVMCGAMLVCYALAMFRALQWAQWLALTSAAGAAALLAVRIARGHGTDMLRSFGKNVFTPGLLCFVLLAVLYYRGAQGHMVIETDDIYYWGVEARSIYAQNGLVDAFRHLSPRFMTYTPGMQLFQWIGLSAYGEWNESVLYVGLWLFYAMFLLPFTQRITWRKAYWIPVFLLLAVGAPSILSEDAYAMLRVDTALGICLGYALTKAWSVGLSKKDAGFHLLCFSLSLCALSLVKQIGIAWALMAIVFLLLVVRRRAYRNGIKPMQTILACAAPVIVCASWILFSQINQLSGAHLNKTSARIQEILNGAWTPVGDFWDIPRAILGVLWHAESQLQFSDNRWIDLPSLFWIALFILAPIMLIPLFREKKKTLLALSLWAAGCFVIFFIGFGFSLMTTFYDESTAMETSSFVFYLTKRYFCPYLIGILMLFVFGTWEAAESRPAMQSTVPRLLSALALCALLLCCNWPHTVHNLLRRDDSSIESHSLFTAEAENFWMDYLEKPEDAIVLYGIESYPFSAEAIQYVIAPTKLVLTVETELTREQFIDLLQSRRVTHIVCMDESNPVYENAVQIIDSEWMDIATPYAVDWDGDIPVLYE